MCLMAALPLVLAAGTPVAEAQQQEEIRIDAGAATQPLPHFWEQMFGSGRANLMLRDSWREDLRAVHGVTGIQYVRGHGILDDDNGVYTEDEHGNPVYNFAYVNQIYEGLLRNGVKPVVEISFMPKKLAFNPDALHPFWYKQNVSPPKSWERWDGLMTAFAKDLVEHFGADEVASWYFEVWNEPNIDFWNGIPRDKSYFELYEHTARDLKAVSPRLRVGGPATAAAQWVTPFLQYVKAHKVPIDFVSSHGYADEEIDNIFPDDPTVPRDTPKDDRVCLAIHKVRGEMNAAGEQALPLFWTEWNVQSDSQAWDTTFVGPGVANTVRECADGSVQQMSFWTFSDVFEEGGPGAEPFTGQFGLRAEYGINKPSFYDFALLHQLGDQLLPNEAKNVLATKAEDGGLAVAVWNLVDPPPTGEKRSPVDAHAGVPSKTVVLQFAGVPARAHVTVQRVDDEHGNVLPVYNAMGRPQYPTDAQVAEMNRRTALPAPEQRELKDGRLQLSLEPDALVLVKVER